MPYKFYAYPKCSTCRKARKKLDELGIPYEAIDITVSPPSAVELKEYQEISGLSLRRFFNTSGMKYRELGLAQKLDTMDKEEALELLASDGMLIRRPLLVGNGKVLSGYQEAAYEALNS